MKQLSLLAVVGVIVSGLFGCQDADNGADLNTDRGVDVIIEGKGTFPRSLVGRWKDQERNWEFVFEPDGTISSAVIDSGVVRVRPGTKVVEIPLKDGGKGRYELGQWSVQYSPKDRELAVEVVVDHYHLETNSFGMEGRSTDWFVGPVSQDSQTWEAQWHSFSELTAFGPDGEELVFGEDPNQNPVGTLMFRKQ